MSQKTILLFLKKIITGFEAWFHFIPLPNMLLHFYIQYIFIEFLLFILLIFLER